MDYEKDQLNIPALSTIDEILERLRFLKYRTQLRNVCHLVHMREFYGYLDEYYYLYGGTAKMHKFIMLKISSDAIENLLYCALCDCELGAENEAIKNGHIIYAELIEVCKKRGIISKETAADIHSIRKHRNDTHPDNQSDLFVQMEDGLFDKEEDLLETVVSEIEDFYAMKDYGPK